MRVALADLALNVEQAGDGPPLLALHGFTGSSASWQPLIGQLAATRCTIAVDLIGHGQSDAPADPARYHADACVADLVAILDLLGLEQTAVLGYSMGGRIALQLAATKPERISALVLESATAGIRDNAERQQRIASDETLARMIEEQGIDAFVRYWQQIPLFASQAQLPNAVRDHLAAQRLRNNPAGLAASLRGMGAGQQPPQWEHLARLRMPVLLLAGEHDHKYRGLAAAMHTALPQARITIVPNAGHTIHLEQPAIFAQLVTTFLQHTDPLHTSSPAPEASAL